MFCFRYLGIDNQTMVTLHTMDEEVDDCRIVMETANLEDIVTTLMR